MPASSEAARPSIQVAISAPIELMWLIHWAGAGHSHGGTFAALDELRLRRGPDLEKLWGERLAQYSTELVVLAFRSGTILDRELNRFFDRIEAAIDDPRMPSLLSEGPREREIVQERLERLRSDKPIRKRYIEVLHRIWSDMEAEWETTGRPSVTAEAQRWTRDLEAGTPYRQILQVQQIWPPRPEADGVADAAAADGNLILNPAWFGGKIHFLEFDGQVYVGRGMHLGEPSFKEVAVEVSAHIKALADPTRLAILLRLAREPASVTEIARQFDLSQPTVSAHVNVLRQAGLLEEKTVGRSAQLSASKDGVRRLFANAEESLVRAFRA